MKPYQKNALKVAEQWAYRNNPLVYMKRDLAQLSANEKVLQRGVEVKDQVLPQRISLEENTRRIGFYQENHHSTATADHPDQYNLVGNKAYKYLKARVFFKDINHMHMTPTTNSEGYSWCVQFQKTALIKNNAMGWSHSNPSEMVQLYFSTEVEAIEYCQANGWHFEVSYPHFRNHTRKSYADNSKWKGYPVDSIEEF